MHNTDRRSLWGARRCVSCLLLKVQIHGRRFCQAGTSSNQSEVEESVTTGVGCDPSHRHSICSRAGLLLLQLLIQHQQPFERIVPSVIVMSPIAFS